MNRQATKKRERERTPNNRTTTGFRISDELWAVLQPRLSVHVNTHRFGGGAHERLIATVRMPSSTCLSNGMRVRKRWIKPSCVRTRAAHDRFQEWVQAGVFLKLWQAGIEQFEELCGIDWDWLSMDGAMRHLPRWAGEKTGPNPTDRGKSGVKRSLRTFGHGIPIGLTIEGANRHDMKLVRPTIESIIVDRPEPSEVHPQGMCLA
jgi:putative transposase